jgi:hypothetical protein
MSQEQSRPRRAPSERRQSSGTTNVNSTLSIIIAVLAVLLGFFILRDIRNDQTGQSTVAETETTVDPTQTTVGEVVVPTTLVLTSFKIQVTTELQGRGYIVQPANNKSEITPKQTVTVVYYLLGSEQAAAAVANALGGVGIAAMPEPIPTESGNLGEATVLILLGTDLAGKPLGTGAAVSVPVVPAVTTTTG